MRKFILRELDRAGLGHNTFSQAAVDLIVRPADDGHAPGPQQVRRLPDRGRPSATKAIDIDIVNRVLMQPHWQTDANLLDSSPENKP